MLFRSVLLLQTIDGAFGCASDQGFEFSERVFDRLQIRFVGHQLEKPVLVRRQFGRWMAVDLLEYLDGNRLIGASIMTKR